MGEPARSEYESAVEVVRFLERIFCVMRVWENGLAWDARGFE